MKLVSGKDVSNGKIFFLLPSLFVDFLTQDTKAVKSSYGLNK